MIDIINSVNTIDNSLDTLIIKKQEAMAKVIQSLINHGMLAYVKEPVIFLKEAHDEHGCGRTGKVLPREVS